MKHFGLAVKAALGVCGASVGSQRHGVHATGLRSQNNPLIPLERQRQAHREQYEGSRPPVFVRFIEPINGSAVSGPDVRLHFRLLTSPPESSSNARELTVSEMQDLYNLDMMCFKLHGFDEKPEICASLHKTYVKIKDALPAKWHTVSARIKSSSSERTLDVAGDRVSVFVSLEGYDLLDMCGDSSCLDTTELRSAYFDYVYRHPKWEYNWLDNTFFAYEPRSIISSTASVRSALGEVISSYGIRSMLDAACGDVSWMSLVPKIEDVLYTGADISQQAIDDNQIKFDFWEFGVGGFDPEIVEPITELTKQQRGLQAPVFVQADLVEGLPQSQDGKPFDLIFVRDLMLHLPARHNLKLLRNIQASGARFLMASTFVEADENEVSETFVPQVGHNINLSLPPYCLPEPLALINDHSSERSDLRMGLWELSSDEPLVFDEACGHIAVA